MFLFLFFSLHLLYLYIEWEFVSKLGSWPTLVKGVGMGHSGFGDGVHRKR